MKKTRILFVMSILLLLSIITVSAYSHQIGDLIGKVLYTDIVTILDGKPISSVNIGGRTAIIVEDLKDYGYNVTWDEDKRILDVETEEQSDSNTVSTITGMIMLPDGQVAPEGGIEIEIGARMANEVISTKEASGVPGTLVKYTKTVIYEGNNFATYSIQLPIKPKEYQLQIEGKYNKKKVLDYISITDGKNVNVNHVLDMDIK